MAKNIDYSRSGQTKGEKKYNRHQLLRKLRNISAKDRVQLENDLFDDKAKYSEAMIEKANELLMYLDDSSIDYQLIARNDGGGLLAKTKGLAGSNFVITVAAQDYLAFDKRSGSYNMLSGEYNVGNVFANGFNYYLDSRAELQKSALEYIRKNDIKKGSKEWKEVWSKTFNDERTKKYKENRVTYLIEGLTGQVPVKPIFNKGSMRSDVLYDNAYTILDDYGRPIVKFYRRSLKSNDVELPFVEKFIELKNENAESLKETPLKQMIYDTNAMINEMKDEKDYVTKNVNGLEISEMYENISYDDATFEGLNLDTLLAFQNRNDIAQAIAYEISNNPNFNLNHPDIIGEKGLKDLLMEETAGVNAEIVQPEELGETDYQKQKYTEIVLYIKELLEKQGLHDIEANFDSDNVLHWKGKASEYNRKEKTIIDKEVAGEIGQIFIPNKQGLVKTKFKTLDDSDDRNYNMVMGYVGYYKSNAKQTTSVPETVLINGKHEVVASRNSRGELIPFKTPKGTFVRPELFPEERLNEYNRSVSIYNEQNPENKLQLVASKEVERTLRNRLRFKGFEQTLKQQLEALVSKQILQDNTYSLDNTSMNKLYHGDVYGIRISEENLDKQDVIKTYQNRVKFDESVLNLPISELDNDFVGKNTDEYQGEDSSHRFNIRELDGIFDRTLSSDGANLGLVRYFNKGSKVLSTGEVVVSNEGINGSTFVKDSLPFTEADPADRSMMAGNQYMKARHVSKANVAYITYKGYTFEDGSVVSKKFAKEQGAIVNGYDDNGEPIPLEIGDKISDLHGNKSTISYIASENDAVFKENPNLDVIMNPHSVPSRLNTGLVLEMQSSGEEQNIYHEGERIASAAPLNIVITDITARDKTQTYEDNSVRKGRAFGNQLGWVANALNLDETMKEVYGNNTNAFGKLRAYMNVTGLDIDEDTAIILSNGFNNGKHQPPEFVEQIEVKQSLNLPENGGYMKLPIEVELPSGIKTRYLNVLPEKYRKTHDLYDGSRMYHEYTTSYVNIAKSALAYDELDEKYKVKLQNKIENIEQQDLANIDLHDNNEVQRLRDSLTNQDDIKEFDKHINNHNKDAQNQANHIQSSVNALTSRIIEEKLGGRSNLIERLDQYGDKHLSRSKNTQAVKQSIIKREIMSKEVPNSVSSVVTAYPSVDINTIKVSSDIYNKLNLVNEQDRVLLWRDPALHDGSMRSFKVEKSDDIVGVGINPLVTESFGMDFDGDTVGLYAPRSREAQKEIAENASIESNLLDATTREFSGNIGMDFVSSAYKQGYIRDDNNSIIQGPLKDREEEIKKNDGTWLNPKDQLQLILNEMAAKENGAEQINRLWQDIVVSEQNIAASKIEFKDRESLKNSLMYMAKIGAKGKPSNIVNPIVEKNMQDFEEQNKRPITYLERMEQPDLYISEQSTVMDYYDRGKEMCYHKSKFEQDNTGKHRRAYEKMNNPYRTIKSEDGKEKTVRSIGSLGYDQDKTRMAQSGKTDLTGLAGVKSQKLVSLMYDKKDGAMAAMEVTEPLTQATLKLKHDPKKTPEIQKLLTDFDSMINEGGYTKEEFTKDFLKMYDDVGLKVRENHLHEVFDTLSKKDSEGIKRTQPIQEVIEQKMPPLMKANMYGYDAMKECACGIEKKTQVDQAQYINQVLDSKGNWVDKDININNQYEYGNMKALKDITMGNEEPTHLNTFKSGDKTALYIPENLREVTISSRKNLAEQFHKKIQMENFKETAKTADKEKTQPENNKAKHQFQTSQQTKAELNKERLEGIESPTKKIEPSYELEM
ncbi:hypothetical protein KXP69_002277 [Staphylococcus pseudintermedius]|nr:hypothetical protein [Staphylococcus pseudintermedius]MDE9937891.1 hypothetical protein [Staphylococcus pseudintermedius]